MKARIEFTVEVDDDVRRKINVACGRPGLATRDEVRDWFRKHGEQSGATKLWDVDSGARATSPSPTRCSSCEALQAVVGDAGHDPAGVRCAQHRPSGAECPDCGSDRAECHEDRHNHWHGCPDCGAVDLYRGRIPADARLLADQDAAEGDGIGDPT